MDEIQKEKKYHDKINRTLYIYSELLQGNVVEKASLPNILVSVRKVFNEILKI